jgi:hypothetical protein
MFTRSFRSGFFKPLILRLGRRGKKFRVSFAKQEAGINYLSHSHGWIVYQMVVLGFRKVRPFPCSLPVLSRLERLPPPVMRFFDVFLPGLLMMVNNWVNGSD